MSLKRFVLLAIILLSAGSAFAQSFPARWPRVSIDTVQFVPDSLLQQGETDPFYFDYQTDTFVVEGYIAFDPRYYGLSGSRSRASAWLMDSTIYQPFGGIEFMMETGNYDQVDGVDNAEPQTNFFANCRPGNKIRAAAVVDVFDGEQQMEILLQRVEIIAINQPEVQPVVVGVDDFMQSDGAGGFEWQPETGEPYEGSLVEFQDVTVVGVDGGPDRYEWAIQDDQGNRIQIRDMSTWLRNDQNSFAEINDNELQNYTFTPPSNGSRLTYLRGMLYTYQGNEYWLAPRDTSDWRIGEAFPVVRSEFRRPVVAGPNDAVEVFAEIEDTDGSINSAELHYRVPDTDANFTTVSMSPVNNSYWKAEIPAQAAGTLVQYWIGATDNNNNSVAFPDSVGNNSYFKVVENGVISDLAELQEPIEGGSASAWVGDTLDRVNITALVSATTSQYLQNLARGDGQYAGLQADTTPYSGIFIKALPDGSDVEDWEIGDEIQIAGGVVEEIFGVSYLSFIDGDNNFNLGASSGLQPALLNVDSAIASNEGDGSYLEQYEGMLVRFEDVVVSDRNADGDTSFSRFFGEWAFARDTSQQDFGFRVDDASGFVPQSLPQDSFQRGDSLSYVQGLMYRSFGNWKLIPRDLADISKFAATAVEEVQGHEAWEALRLYPNPADAEVTLEIEARESGYHTLQLMDLSGRSVMTKTLNVQTGINQFRFDLSRLDEGLYLYQLGQRPVGKLQVR